MKTKYLSIDDLRHRRELPTDSVLNCIVSVYPGATWSDKKGDWMFSSHPFRRPDGRQPWYNLGDLLLKPPAPELAALQAAIRGESDPAQRAALKSAMIGFTPSGFFEPTRKAGNLQHHTALIAFDIDAKDNAGRLKNYDRLQYEIASLPYTAYCGRSLSGAGLWGLFAIPRKDAARLHKSYFAAMQEDFACMAVIIDDAPSNVASLRFYAHDPDAYTNHYPRLYDRLYIAPEIPKPKQQTYTSTRTRIDGTSQRTGDEFNETADICAMLEHYGWKPAGKDGDGIRYTRPGKQSGKSAWAIPARNLVYIWTSSTGLEPNKTYTPFDLYAKMEHGGDWKAAARAIREGE